VDNLKRPLTILIIAVIAVSTAAPAIRLGSGPAISVAFWRVTLATLGVMILAWVLRKDGVRPTLRQGFIPLAGVFLGLHFWVWIASLEWITVSRSVLLVSTQPVWAALLGRMFLRETVGTRGWQGILLALLGSAVATGGLRGSGRGDFLALAGAVLAAAYMVVGRRERQQWELFPFLLRVYGWASLTLLAALAATGAPILPVRVQEWWLYLFLAAVPTGIGHSLYNYSLRHLPAYSVATAITAEPLGASILAFVLFGETPETTTWMAAPLVVGGLMLVVRGNRATSAPATRAGS
jgi:drug/metabolite transporter (DMT)-like permease